MHIQIIIKFLTIHIFHNSKKEEGYSQIKKNSKARMLFCTKKKTQIICIQNGIHTQNHAIIIIILNSCIQMLIYSELHNFRWGLLCPGMLTKSGKKRTASFHVVCLWKIQIDDTFIINEFKKKRSFSMPPPEKWATKLRNMNMSLLLCSHQHSKYNASFSKTLILKNLTTCACDTQVASS